MSKTKWPKPTKYDILRAAQYAYYVIKQPFVTDKEFDDLESEFQFENPNKKTPVGSDNRGDYTEQERVLALYFAFRAYFKQKGIKAPTIRQVEASANPSKYAPKGHVEEIARHSKRKMKQGLLDLK